MFENINEIMAAIELRVPHASLPAGFDYPRFVQLITRSYPTPEVILVADERLFLHWFKMCAG